MAISAGWRLLTLLWHSRTASLAQTVRYFSRAPGVRGAVRVWVMMRASLALLVVCEMRFRAIR